MAIDKATMLDALLRHNYLPLQRKRTEEIPPVLSSGTFAHRAAKAVIGAKHRCRDGWDAVEYRLTRFNGVSRILSIPHPVAHAYLCLELHEHWDKISPLLESTNSLSLPKCHADGRLFVMDYEGFEVKSCRESEMGFGSRFVVHTDIKNCYPSIYTHAMAWALVGIQEAKAKQGHQFRGLWFNQLDEKMRWNKRNETQGIGVGPGTSNIVAEIILGRIDATLSQNGFRFTRIIDDYTCYCETELEAREFMRRLGEELSNYKLFLGIDKTTVSALPTALKKKWVTEVASMVPNTRVLNFRDAINFLNGIVPIAKAHPDGSVYKYAVRAILNKERTAGDDKKILQYVLNLAFHCPALIPCLDGFLENVQDLDFDFSGHLKRLCQENAQYHHSDGMAWCIHFLNHYGYGIDEELCKMITQTGDCISLLLLTQNKEQYCKRAVVEFLKAQVRGWSVHEIDQYWLLFYQLYLSGDFDSPYAKEQSFEILKEHGVDFFDTRPVGAFDFDTIEQLA